MHQGIMELLNKIKEQEEENQRLRSCCEQLSDSLKKTAERFSEATDSLQRSNQSIENMRNENEELKKKNELLKSENDSLKENEKKLSSELKECKEYIDQLLTKVRRYKERTPEAIAKKAEEKAAAIEESARKESERRMAELDRMAEKKMKSLENRFQWHKEKYNIIYGSAIAYGVLITFFAGFRSEAFMSDFSSFWTGAWTGIKWIGSGVWWISSSVARLSSLISNPTLSAIVYWLIAGLITIAIGGVAVVLIIMLLLYLAEEMDDCFGLDSLYVLLATTAAAVFFAEPIRQAVPFNLLLMVLLVNAAYGLGKYFLFSRR